MPVTAAEIADAGKIGLDYYFRNNPIDQIKTERPWLAALMRRKRPFSGAKQFCVEQLRTNYGSNYQWYYGTQVVTYNRRQSIEQTNFPIRGAHDGFFLDEDRLVQNGISINSDDGPRGRATADEAVALTNLIEEQAEILRLGFEEKMDFEMHLAGTQHPEALAGLDFLISLTPAVGTVGGINRATNAWWRNQAFPGITAANVLDRVETAWRACTRNGGRPDLIMAGSNMVDLFRGAAAGVIQRYTRLSTSGQAPDMDPTIGPGPGGGVDTGLHIHGVSILWNPVFADLDAALAPATTWENRMYFINTNHMRLRPIRGHDMISRRPTRPHDQYVTYWATTWKGSLTINRSTCHAVLNI